MEAKTVITMLRLNDKDFNEYEVALPLKDLDEYFKAMGWLEDYYKREFLTIGMKGRFEFLDYEQNINIQLLNDLLLKFQELDEEDQEIVLLLTHREGDTFEAFLYTMNNFRKYLLVPARLKTEEDVSKYIINLICHNKFLKIFEEAICFEDFYSCLFEYDIAFFVSNRILVKIENLLD